MGSSILLYHTQCPRCARRGRDSHGDNLAVFDDGHTWCFSCKYFTPPNTRGILEPRKKKVTELIPLPYDLISLLETDNKEAWNWIAPFQLSVAEIESNHISFSEDGFLGAKPMIIFPIFNGDGTLSAYTGRNLGINTRSKWLHRGPIADSVYGIIPRKKLRLDTCVLVEDPISAIKVGRVQDVYCMFTKQPSASLVRWMMLNYNTIYIWPDFDAVKDGIKLESELAPFFKEHRIIVTEKDPKWYSTEEIRNFLEE